MSKTTPGYSVLVLAPFAREQGPALVNTFHAADWANALETMGPRFHVPVDQALCPEGRVLVSATLLNHFSPRGLLRTVPYLARLAEAASFLSQSVRAEACAAETAGVLGERFGDLPLRTDGRLSQTSAWPQAGASPDAACNGPWLGEVLRDCGEQSGQGTPKSWLARAMELMGGVLSAILADADYRRHEAAWRGFSAMAREAAKAGLGKVGFRLVCTDAGRLADTLARLRQPLRRDVPHLCLADVEPGPVSGDLAPLRALLDQAESLWLPTAAALPPDGVSNRGLDPRLDKTLGLLRGHPGAGRFLLLANRFSVRPVWSPREAPGTLGLTEAEPLWLSPVWGFGTLAALSLFYSGWPTCFASDRRVMMEDLAPLPNGLATELDAAGALAGELLGLGVTPLRGVPGEDRLELPRETALDGSGFSFSLFFARILGQLHLLSPSNLAGRDPADLARELLDDLFVSTRVATPPDLDVSCADSTLSVSFTPPERVLAATRLSFRFRLPDETPFSS